MTLQSDTDGADVISWLAGRDVPCPLCGYNLRGLASPRCPECGQPLRLGVSLAEPFLKAWVALLIALLLPAGFGLLMLFGIGYAIVRGAAVEIFTGLNRVPIGPLLVSLHLMACVPSAIAAIAGRRRFLRMGRSRQVALATTAWLAIGATLLYVLSQFVR